jgi:DNA-binding Lrp family transcriptional regulator
MFATFARALPRGASFRGVDNLDRQILAVLQAEGRITLTELAARVRLSVSRCQRRVREMEADGTIRGYRAVVDPASMGFGFEVLAFATLARPGAVEEFDDAIAAIPQIIEAQRLFGEPDYLIRVVATDRDDYQQLYDSVLSRMPGLRSLNSTIVMKQAVAPRPLPSPR